METDRGTGLFHPERELVNQIRSERDPDYVRVVRCKDCKHRYVTGHTTQYYTCDYLDAENRDDGYCSHGERK